MKRIISFSLFISFFSLAFSQGVDRTKAPKAGPAPVINIADPATFSLPNGLRVFVVTNTKLPQVSATLTIDRDPIFEGDKAGMVEMSGSMMRRGTTKMSKSELDETIDFLGADISSSSVSVSGSSLKQNFSQVMALMAEVALRPAFAADELEKVRKQTLSGLEAEKDDPNAISNKIGGMLLYGKNHPYGEFETEETVQKVTVDDIKKYHTTYWKPNIAYLVLVGDITASEGFKLATDNFGTWAKGEIPKLQYDSVSSPAKTYVAIIDRPASVQSIISLDAPLQLKPGAPDVIPASVMNSILGGGFSSRLMQNLREKYAFTYGARSSIGSDRLVGHFGADASVRNEKTDSAVGQFIYEMNRIRSEAVQDSELVSIKNYMSGGFARSLENPGTIASFALNIARYNLPNDYYRNYLTRLNAVTADDVKTMANKYVPTGKLIISIVGNAKEIAPGLEKYGEVKYFDIKGNPISAPSAKSVDAGIRAEDVLKKAVVASGGEAAISALKDITLTGTVNVMGQTLSYVQKNILPDGFSASVKMGEMALMNQMKKGKEYSSSMQGNKQELDEASKRELDARAALVEERYYLQSQDYKFDVKGIESVDGKDAYQLQITQPDSSIRNVFYEVSTGLKLQEMREQEMGQMGKVNVITKFLEYKDVNGVKVPVKLVMDFGVMKQEINITDVKANQGLKLTDL